jgi:hypothetical protein
MGFTKLADTLVYSSLLGEDDSVFKVWIILLSLTKQDGIAPISSTFLETITKKPPEEIERCLNKLSSPDLKSRSSDFEGRRIERVSGGFKILNYAKYRQYDYSSNPDAVRKRLKRNSKKKTLSQPQQQADNVRTFLDMSGHSASASASSSSSDLEILEGKEDTKLESVSKQRGIGKGEEKPDWRTDFNIYLEQARTAFNNITNDDAWQEERQRYHPGLNIPTSCGKMFQDFWGTEAGWQHKKRSKTKVIDWTETINNGLSIRANQVWLPRNEGREYSELDEHKKNEQMLRERGLLDKQQPQKHIGRYRLCQ